MDSNSVISTILDKFRTDNTIFGDNVFFIKDAQDLQQRGLTDKFMAMAYARRSGATVPIFRGGLYDLQHPYRFIFQLHKSVSKDSAEKSLFGQMSQYSDTVKIQRYFTDSAEVYKMETGDPQTPDMWIFAFDVIVTEEVFPGHCDCITIENCQS